MKKLGQHFLINEAALQKIVQALHLKPGETVIEIGAGGGGLTRHLLKSGAEIIAIEKDSHLVERLNDEFKTKIKIIEGDVLKILPKLTNSLKPKNYKLTGNIPYYITGYLLRTISELENKPSLIVLTLQKEVAERIAAAPPKMNLLAASVQFWAKPEIISYLPKAYFQPIPKVDSAIIRLEVKSQKSKVKSKSYYPFIKILFKQPRKTIFNNLRQEYDAEKIAQIARKLKIDLGWRAQNLSLEQIQRLSVI